MAADKALSVTPSPSEKGVPDFYKTDTSRTGTLQPSGSGLGLSIVRAIVERHGGTITASNAPGSGARFEIALPA